MDRKKIDIEALITRVGKLPPMPLVAQRALKLIRDPNSSMADLGKVLVLDPALAAFVLRLVNSAYFGLSTPVSTVKQAVVYLGHSSIRSLVFSASLMTLLDDPLPGYGLRKGDLWRHSLGVAAGARLVAAQFGAEFAEEAYHAGLLADIGKLALEVAHQNVVAVEEYGQIPFDELEMELFGVDHAVIGGELGRRWNLPTALIDAIRHHHHPSLAEEGAVLAAAVHVADVAMMMIGVGIGSDGLQYEIDHAAYDRLGWGESRFDELVSRVIPLVAEVDAFSEMS